MNFPKHIIGLKKLSKEQLESIFYETADFKKVLLDKNQDVKELLKGKTVLNLFFENSTRTRVSFELAEKLLGMKTVNFSTESSSLSKGESEVDTIRNIDAMKFDYIVTRHSSNGFPDIVIENSSAIVLNAGDGTNEHPTQGLLDMFTLKEIFGSLEGLKVCIAGNISHSRVARSDIYGLKKFGAEISLCAPSVYLPNDADELGVNVIHSMDEAVKHNDAIVLLRIQLERDAGKLLPSLDEYNAQYGMNQSRLEINPQIKVLHPGPWNTGVELDQFVVDSHNFYGYKQVTNGVAVKLALFKLLNEAD